MQSEWATIFTSTSASATRTRGFIGSGGMEHEATDAENQVLAATGENSEEAGIARRDALSAFGSRSRHARA